MLFKDVLVEISSELEKEFERLFELALSSQANEGDLLMVHVNGWYDPELTKNVTMSNGQKALPYLIGDGVEGHADQTHYDFINQYRNQISELTYADYKKLHKWDPERNEEIDKLLFEEQMTIHLEAMVYLKIWEGDAFIKTWYQFVRILKGEPYDWHFKIKPTPGAEGLAMRHELIRLFIRDELKPFSEKFYDAFNRSYKTQIRNSIAHSKFSFLGRNMHPNNRVDGEAQNSIGNVEFDTWIEMFHTAIILHNFYVMLNNKINLHYGKLYLKEERAIEIVITGDNGKPIVKELHWREEFRDWNWRKS